MKRTNIRIEGGYSLLNNGFTLMELLGVIIILAVIALIAVPIILNIVGSSKKSAVLRSGELYLKTVETEIARENLNSQFNPTTCTIESDGNLTCDEGKVLTIKVNGSKPTSGTITLQNGKIKEVTVMILSGFELEKKQEERLKIKDEVQDTTPAEVKVNVNKITTNSITVTVEAIDLESGIKEYQYSIDNNNYKTGNNTYTFNNLNLGKKYTIYVKVINGNDLETLKDIEATTMSIDMPAYEIDTTEVSSSKTVTINYPEVNGQELKYEYSTDKGKTWISATKSQSVLFTSNGSIIARVTDGTNIITSNTFTVSNIVNYLMPISEFGTSESTFLGGSIKRSQVETITITNTKKISENAIGSWDASENQNKSIMAWYTDVDNNGLYELYIGDEGRVKANQNSMYLFALFINVTSIDVSYLDTSDVTIMREMFRNCNKLTSLDLRSLDTSNVTNMNQMFGWCFALNSIDVSSFDTRNVVDMLNMFRQCNSLVSLDLSNFNTSKVVGMNEMFRQCTNLTNLDVSSFDISNVNNLYGMFYGCSSIETLDLSSWNVSQVNNVAGMFSNCSNLKTIDIRGGSLSNIIGYRDDYVNNVFTNCSKLTTIYVRDNASKTFVTNRLNDVGKTGVTITIV